MSTARRAVAGPLVCDAYTPGLSSRTLACPRPSPRAGKDKTEIADVQAIVRAGQALCVPQRHGQRYRKALRRHECCRPIGETDIQTVGVRVRFRPQLPIVETAIPTELILEL